MYEDLKNKAVTNLKKDRAKKKGVHIVGVVFSAISILLFVISMNFNAYVAYWIKLPILIFALVYAIIYFSVFGLPFLGLEDEISEEEIEREIVKIYKLQTKNESNVKDDIDELELKEIESLKHKWDDEDEFV